MVMLSPDFPSSGVNFSIFGAIPKQDLPWAAFSADWNFGLSLFGLAALASGAALGFLAFLSVSAAWDGPVTVAAITNDKTPAIPTRVARACLDISVLLFAAWMCDAHYSSIVEMSPGS